MVPALRPLAADALHVTLVFLGEQAAADAPVIAGAVAGLGRPVGELRVTGEAWLPPRSPGVLVADLAAADGRLAALQSAVATALAPWHEADPRAFRPHVTVARVRGRLRPGARAPAPPPAAFAPAALVLYRSAAGRAGVRYEPQARVAL